VTKSRVDLAPSEKENTILSIMGRKGSGKSTLVREIMNSGQFPRIFVLDTNGEYGLEDGFEITHTVKAGAKAMLRVRNRDEFRISLRERDTEQLVKLLDVAFEIPHHLMVIEETHFYVKPAYLPAEISQMVRLGRHRAISQIYVSQRPSGLNRDLTSQSDFIVTFRQSEPRDIKWLGEVAGDGAEDVRNLPDYKVRVWTLGDPAKMPLPVLKRIPDKNRLDLFQRRA
jgi:DNA helicase HerA-like ATPase